MGGSAVKQCDCPSTAEWPARSACSRRNLGGEAAPGSSLKPASERRDPHFVMLCPLLMEDALAALRGVVESGFTVSQIATLDPWAAEPNGDPIEVRAYMEERDYDCALLDAPGARRVIVRDQLCGSIRSLEEVARPVTTADLVTSTLSLIDTLEILGEREYLFVLDRDEIVGVVTRADAQKPAVSLVTFALVLLAQAALNNLITVRLGHEWPDLFADVTRAEIDRVYEERRWNNSEINRIDCLTTAQRLNLMAKDRALRSLFGFESRNAADAFVKEMLETRNALAHGGDLLSISPDPHSALKRFSQVRDFSNMVQRACAAPDEV
jgi:hypothetical protein